MCVRNMQAVRYLRISTLKIADVRSGKCEGDSIICILTMTGT